MLKNKFSQYLPYNNFMSVCELQIWDILSTKYVAGSIEEPVHWE